ncbi:hypothetical protein PO909_016009 [Leuciscus waleckii]
MESGTFYVCRNINNRSRPPTQSRSKNEGKDGKQTGSRCLVLMTVCLGLICVLLLVFITLYITITAERDLKGNARFFIPNERKNWSESRQYCRDRGADLMIINTEVKQRFITSLVKERVWIGLSDSETEGIMKWVDNSALNQGFWDSGEPNNLGNEDCIELDPGRDRMNNWNDMSCMFEEKFICEK